jgi:Mce-associated membrane protein
VTSEARERLREEDTVTTEEAVIPQDTATPPRVALAGEKAPRARAADREGEGTPAGRGTRLSVPLVQVLAVLLLLLLGAAGWLWVSRPSPSSVSTGDYVEVLQAARSEVVDLTSFDYETLDDDIAQAKKITVGDLRDESVKQLNSSRQQLTDQQAVVNTEVVSAGVTRADGSSGTVLLVLQSTQKTKAAAQAQVVRYRIEAQLRKTGGRWLLSGISGR